MSNLIKFIIPLFVIVATPMITPVVEAKASKPTKCFSVVSNRVVVKRSINPTQLEYLKVIRVTQPTYENIIFNFSLENQIKQCLIQGKIINGFTIPQIMVKPGMVSINSETRYKSTTTKFKVQDTNSSFNINAKGYVDVTFSPATGYTVKASLVRL